MTKSAEYEFTNLGGGIQRVKLLDHLVDNAGGAKVVLNEWGAIPIGAVSEVGRRESARAVQSHAR